MTRIVAGVYGGRRLHVPAGRDTRPTSDRVREALFSALESLTELAGARVADLYAGSGAVGLEALSRGAGSVLFVEADPRAVKVIKDNVRALKAAADLTQARVERVVTVPPAEPYDVVFADPPYAIPDADVTALLAALVDAGWLAPDAVLVLERSSRSPAPTWPPGVTPLHSRRYGETTLWYARRD